MREFIEEHGGALNCLTWTIRKNYKNNICKGAQIPLTGLGDNKDCSHYQKDTDILFYKMNNLQL